MLHKFYVFFRLSVASSIITSFAVLLVPYIGMSDSLANKLFSYLLGFIIWIGIICIIVFSVLTNKNRRLIEAKLRRKHSGIYRQKRAGCFSFFKNKEAKVSDILLLISLLTTLLLLVVNFKSEFVNIISFSTMLLSFCMHCFLNGKNYVYFKSVKKYFKKRSGSDHELQKQKQN